MLLRQTLTNHTDEGANVLGFVAVWCIAVMIPATLFEKQAGAKVIKPVQDQFYGDRTASLEDPFGHIWFLATHKEELSPEEINKRAEALFKQGGA